MSGCCYGSGFYPSGNLPAYRLLADKQRPDHVVAALAQLLVLAFTPVSILIICFAIFIIFSS